MGSVALIGDNSIEYVSILLDIWNGGDCAVLLDCRIPIQTAIGMMKQANVCKCYIEKRLLHGIDVPFPIDIEFVFFESVSSLAERLPQEYYRKYHINWSRSEAVVLYSSGTTGVAKGIVLSHFAITSNIDAILDYMKPADNDCLYITKAFSHSSTLIGELLVALKSGMKLMVAPTIVPPRVCFPVSKNIT